MPDEETLGTMLEESVLVHGGEETLQYFNDDQILIVNNYTSLSICYQTIRKETSLGVDLEGSLRVGGSINLIQIACTDYMVFIIDIFQIDNLDKNEHLL